MRQTVTLRYLRIAPRKVRSVADLIRGLSVNDAEAQLLVGRRRAAQPLLKLLRAAVTSARHNKRANPDSLYVESVRVDQGPMLKRSLPRARGMATPIQKKMSHVILVLADEGKLGPPRFKIVIEKKAKLPKGDKRTSAKKEKPSKPEERRSSEPKRSGFFKRIFTRKTGV